MPTISPRRMHDMDEDNYYRNIPIQPFHELSHERTPSPHTSTQQQQRSRSPRAYTSNQQNYNNNYRSNSNLINQNNNNSNRPYYNNQSMNRTNYNSFRTSRSPNRQTNYQQSNRMQNSGYQQQPPVNRNNTRSLAFNNEEYFKKFGMPPRPCSRCQFMHWERHCFNHLN